MNTDENTTSQEQHIGVVQTSYTVAITFTQKPDLETRQKLKAAGYLYDKGRWYRNETGSRFATQAIVDQLLAV